ncbi:OmpA family protein [Marinicella gelatinilytica]|uniref:OmpA family protein n=1 Tax=Marinicella gelatinilytica TaxID=2996017 RepID=UPI0022609C5B|nr:OmpA family protein [Marinicella gelatinilytica]MCX7544902.1 OmpA family protein [Marinicella gelatinilytica]
MKQSLNQILKFSLMLSLVALLASCASTPEPDPRVAALKNQLNDLMANPELASRGGEELNRAQDALKTVQNRPKKMDDEAYEYAIYATDRLIELAKYSAEGRYYNDQRRDLAEEQSRLVLESRTLEADLAQQRAERAKSSAMMAEQQRAQALAEAQEAQQMRDAAIQAKAEADRLKKEAQAAAQSAMSEAEQAKLRAEAAQAEAAAAKAAMNSLQNQLSELQAKQTERGLVITLGDVLFEFNKSDLKPGSARNLEPLVKALKDNPNQQVIVEGHTDNVGSRAVNQKLSEERAKSVKSYLVNQGLNGDRIQTKGLGFDFPVASNDDASGRQRNRRVEIILPDIEPEDIEE